MPMKGDMARYFARFGKNGGKKAAQNMTAAQRKERARKAGLARQAKARAGKGEQQ